MTPSVLDPARQALLDETRRLVSEVDLRVEGLGLEAATRKALADSLEQLALPLPARGGRGVQRRQERVHQRAPGRAGSRGGSDADHLAGGHRPARSRGDPDDAPRRHRGDHRSRRHTARDGDRGHAGHERGAPRARGPHAGLPAAGRPRALRHVHRPAVHREREAVPRGDPAVGQEGGARPQQGRPPAGVGGPGEGRRLRARAGREDPGRLARGLRALRTGSAALGRAGRREGTRGKRPSGLSRRRSPRLSTRRSASA